MEAVKQRTLHQDIISTLDDCPVSYNLVKRWCSEFKYGIASYDKIHAGGLPITATIRILKRFMI